ncbi:MAG: 2-oxoacid:ferredoxin oxidoreductase subunit beta [Planctomycetes bacterium]|nr:2-oxoacid:ferredoxin oxidoreductase subunit beta [Planctomycetota bacterium]
MATATPTSTPTPQAPAVNRLNRQLPDYKGLPSTLCAGCGHDVITGQIARAYWESGVEPWSLAKLSGIGCSSKTTAYFLSKSHGFNAVHGRMAAIAAGVTAANRRLALIGVSGDGDTASIGFSHFLHTVRRNVRMVYVIENNGVYGLTKGQFSATADRGSVRKGGVDVNESYPIDCCALAIEMGCSFVARSFSGDTKQLLQLLKAAIAHPGMAVLDVVSPCITFNNHEGSTKSYKFAKAQEDPLHEIGFVPHFEPMLVDVDPGKTKVIDLPDGGKITLTKLATDYDPANRAGALNLLAQDKIERRFHTGLIYHNPSPSLSFIEQMGMVDEPLATLPQSSTRPGREVLEQVMESLS